MTTKKTTEEWVPSFRRQIKLTCGIGWKVFNSRGRIRLEVRQGDKSQTAMLPYEWNEANSHPAVNRIEQIFKRYSTEKITLTQAAQNTDTSSNKQEVDFKKLFAEFRKFRPTASDRTWRTKYIPVLRNVEHAFVGQPPINGEKLCSHVLQQWEHGSRQRQIMRQHLYAFLKWAVQRNYLKPIYLPPADAPETLNPKRDGYALSDAQILRLLENLPEGETHDRWRFAIQLCAVYGLRPEELRYLIIKDGPKGAALWSIYRKSMGGRKGERTEPRKLNALLVKDSDGSYIDWNLQSRLQIGEQLPPLGKPGKAGEAVGTYLKRRAAWTQLKEEAKNQGEVLTAYSFRHRYAKASHALGLPIANIAQAMGHTIEVHLTSYARFTPDATSDLYARAQAGEVKSII
ncbi:MAG: site-specific integrase [Prochlorococcus sp.]